LPSTAGEFVKRMACAVASRSRSSMIVGGVFEIDGVAPNKR